MDVILLSPSILDYFSGSDRAWIMSGLAIHSRTKESNVITCFAVTSSPQFSRALCTEIGLAGAPLGDVNATQYEIAGQRDLLIFVKLPSSHC